MSYLAFIHTHISKEHHENISICQILHKRKTPTSRLNFIFLFKIDNVQDSCQTIETMVVSLTWKTSFRMVTFSNGSSKEMVFRLHDIDENFRLIRLFHYQRVKGHSCYRQYQNLPAFIVCRLC